MGYFIEVHLRIDSNSGNLVRREGPFSLESILDERERIEQSYKTDPQYITQIVRLDH